MELGPSFKVTFPDGEMEATPDNTVLFRHMGSLAMYDHVFLVKNKEEAKGAYLFRTHPSYETIADYMMDNDYPAHINLRNVSECDAKAFEKMVHESASSELEAGIPEDWLKSD